MVLNTIRQRMFIQGTREGQRLFLLQKERRHLRMPLIWLLRYGRIELRTPII